MTASTSTAAKAPAPANNGAGEGVALVTMNNAEIYRASTDAAGLSREIVLSTAMEIQRRRYVKVEGWQAIAIAHGCAASSREVEQIEGGVRAVGQVRRMSDGHVIAEAEGFVGTDEPTWYGGEMTDRWGKTKILPKRPDYAIRAMAQTRAISRACRSAFAHVVVMIDANLSTTPAEEVPHDGFAGDAIDAEFTAVEEKAVKAPSQPRPTSVKDRADAFESALEAATTLADLDRKWAKGSGVCAALDTADPERLAGLTERYRQRQNDLDGGFPGDLARAA